MSTANPAAAAGDGAGASQPEKKPSRAMQQLQRFGRSLMLPIAALPAAGILLRLGQDDMIGRFEAWPFAGASSPRRRRCPRARIVLPEK